MKRRGVCRCTLYTIGVAHPDRSTMRAKFITAVARVCDIHFRRRLVRSRPHQRRDGRQVCTVARADVQWDRVVYPEIRERRFRRTIWFWVGSGGGYFRFFFGKREWGWGERNETIETFWTEPTDIWIGSQVSETISLNEVLLNCFREIQHKTVYSKVLG